MKKIGILTSGGDAPGMNSAIHTVVKEASANGHQVFGFNNGYRGLITRDYQFLETAWTERFEGQGGTILGTSRCPEFKDPSVRQEAAQMLKEDGFDALIVIGGDGSYRGALELSKLGVPVVALPGTIDNDIPDTDMTIGFYTAVKSVVSSVDQVKTTAASHGLIFAIEVMGRHAPDIAYWAGTALDVEGIIYRPEDVDLEKIKNQIEHSKNAMKRYQLFIIAEGIMTANAFADFIRSSTNYDVRGLTIGHVQRGGGPAALDRLLAGAYAKRAVEYIVKEEGSGCNLALKSRRIVVQDIEETLNKEKEMIMPFM
ncbi:ATP-dependent 6-phosphofructokinase [Vaginisenegalia massiliensis]|uniref:ATP-dependent 6-phosphofructokinase n=1 Tax=Vaginisenegalia massiliensis TaxID=2058294 RepID=UPI000F522D5F|nr:ATP-dependent 6-phosphofructokinase [Vaginisenegalia massiliensis]